MKDMNTKSFPNKLLIEDNKGSKILKLDNIRSIIIDQSEYVVSIYYFDKNVERTCLYAENKQQAEQFKQCIIDHLKKYTII